MAEKIYIGNSFQKEIYLSTTDEYGNDIPLDLSKYNDSYVAIKTDRSTPDEKSYILKKIFPSEENKGIIIIYLEPEETLKLPLTSYDKLPYLWMFIQLGSTATGETLEVGAFKVKTIEAGIHYYTKQDRTLNDLGPLNSKAIVGYVFDCGCLCDPTILSIDISGGEPYLTDCGYLVTYGEYSIWDLGPLDNKAGVVYDLGYLEKDCYDRI